MDYNTNFNDGIKDRLIKSIYSKMPQYLSSKHRVHKLFFKKCDNDISKYETCIDNKKWYLFYLQKERKYRSVHF